MSMFGHINKIMPSFDEYEVYVKLVVGGSPTLFFFLFFSNFYFSES